MVGYIHSTESFGTVDGPGIRYVIFMQGCPMRCLYCHNPDTWNLKGGTEITIEKVLSEFDRNRAFYSKGGITVTGGEPLLQIDFLTELFKKAKEENIHTCIDTSGITYNAENKDYIKKLDALLEFTDLVMLDIKHIENDYHKALTGHENKNILAFAKYLEEKNIPLWIRHVVVKGYTDDPKHLEKLGEFLSTLKNIKALDVIPYHTLGVNKYEALGLEYKLKDLKPLETSELEAARKHILKGMKKTK